MLAHRWLMGPKNEKAKLFYRRLGFEDIQGSGNNMAYNLMIGKDDFPDYNNNYTSWITHLRYLI